MLKSLLLQNFRNYKNKLFEFEKGLNLIIGENAVGKTNVLEAIHCLSIGKSFKTANLSDLIQFEENFSKIKGINLINENVIEVNLLKNEQGKTLKKYFLNGVFKFNKNFINNFLSIIFKPNDIDIITSFPSLRRNFLDECLIQSDKEYYRTLLLYEKILKQRNALLEKTKKTNFYNSKNFEYWNQILIENGNIITQKRSNLINFINSRSKNVFEIKLEYDKSEINAERLEFYKTAEIGAGITLVGPQRDDLIILGKINNSFRKLKHFGSRGQNRLSVLQLKIIQFNYIKEITSQIPILLLDDIFSELDIKNAQLLLNEINAEQTILTSTQKEIENIDKNLFQKIFEIK